MHDAARNRQKLMVITFYWVIHPLIAVKMNMNVICWWSDGVGGGSVGAQSDSGGLTSSSGAHQPPQHHSGGSSGCAGSSASANSKTKKTRKARTAFTDHQLNTLEQSFERQKYLSVQDRMELASKLNLSDTQVKTWYQNRRSARQTASYCFVIEIIPCFVTLQLHKHYLYLKVFIIEIKLRKLNTVKSLKEICYE